MRLLRSAVVVVALGVFSTPVSAAEITFDFENLNEFDSLSGLDGGGISFSGGIALLSGVSLNELEFPAISGSFVAYDIDPAGIRVDLAGGATSLSGYFTYVAPITLTAFSATGVSIGSVTSQFGSNLGSNELLELTFTGVAAYFTIVGDPNGNSFTMDDLTVNTLDTQPEPIPEPGTMSLLLLGASVLAARQKLRGFRRTSRRVAC